MHRLNQGRNMVWRRQLVDAMTEVKNMRGPCGVRVGVWLTKAV